jgi:SAM-dependent methyltransferase
MTTVSARALAQEILMLAPAVPSSVSCPICLSLLPRTQYDWAFYCERCDYWGSLLRPVTQLLEQDSFLLNTKNEDNPIGFLDDIRKKNFRTVIHHIRNHILPGRRALLEVGCGPGLFLAEAAAEGLKAIGIEPYEAMARRGLKEGLDIRIGLFPDCLADCEAFDVVVFNDVFEHLPDASGVLRTCSRHLVPGGLLAINIPNSRGPFFRLAKLAADWGIPGPWERMWQKDFFSPHIHYVSPKSLGSLCRGSGFEPVGDEVRMATVAFRGLWRRIRAPGNVPLPRAIVLYAGSLLLGAVTPLFESDCFLGLYRKSAEINS